MTVLAFGYLIKLGKNRDVRLVILTLVVQTGINWKLKE